MLVEEGGGWAAMVQNLNLFFLGSSSICASLLVSPSSNFQDLLFSSSKFPANCEAVAF